MTDCGCDKARAELEEYLHRELSDQDLIDVEEHLAGCEECSHEHKVGVTLLDRLQRACQETAPEELRQAILVRLDGVTA